MSLYYHPDLHFYQDTFDLKLKTFQRNSPLKVTSENDEKILWINKELLSEISDVFKCILKYDIHIHENIPGNYIRLLPKMTIEDFELFLSIITMNEFGYKIDLSNVEMLLSLAAYYTVPYVTNQCENFLIEKLTIWHTKKTNYKELKFIGQLSKTYDLKKIPQEKIYLTNVVCEREDDTEWEENHHLADCLQPISNCTLCNSTITRYIRNEDSSRLLCKSCWERIGCPVSNVHDSDTFQNDGEVRHESSSQALYSAIQYVPAEFSPADMLYTSSSTGGGQGHPNVHQLQSGATYAVYQAEGTYSPHVSYYQNSSLTYQPQAVLHSIPNPPYTLSGHTTGAGIGLQEDDNTPQNFNHTTRASPATIQWLLHNYETAEGVSLPRCTLYGHYLKHCSENRLDPVNAASFGKLIRSVFLGLRTRRLGTRGNSKYHYYGIRIKPDSPLNRISEDSLTMAMRQQPTNAARRAKLQMSQCPPSPTNATPTLQSNAVSVISRPNGIAAQQHNVQATQPQVHLQQQQSGFVESNTAVSASEMLVAGGNAAAPNVAPPGGSESYVLNTVVPEVARPSLKSLAPQLECVGLTMGHADLFFTNYRNHCEELFDCVRNQLFGEVDKCWRRFWQATDSGSVDSYDDESNDAMNDDGMNRTQLYTLCIMPEILKYIQSMDFQYYQVMVNSLIPNVLKPIPNSLTQSMRSFAKRLESNLAEILQGAPEVVIRVKLDAVSTLAQAFRRYTSLNHLAQTVRGVLQNSNHISQMLADLNRVDFRNVHEQASWVCYCDPSKVDEIERSFKVALQSQKNLENLADWSSSIVNQILAEYCEKSVGQLIHVSRQFLLKWCFYSSLVMRDLTLRSATSFGSFHLIRLLLDEYMFYLVEQLVSRTENQTTLAVMSQSYRYRTCPEPALYENFFLYQNQGNNPTNQIDGESSSSNNNGRPSVNSLLADQYSNCQNTINTGSGLYQSQTPLQCDINRNEIDINNINNDHQSNRRDSDQNLILQQGRLGSIEIASANRIPETFSSVENSESTKEVYCNTNSGDDNNYFMNQKPPQPALPKNDLVQHQKQSQSQMTTLCLPIADNRYTQENAVADDTDDSTTVAPPSSIEDCRAAKFFVATSNNAGLAANATCIYQQQQQSRSGKDIDHILSPVVKRSKIE